MELTEAKVKAIIPVNNEMPIGCMYPIRYADGSSVAVFFTYDFGTRGQALTETLDKMKSIFEESENLTFAEINQHFINMVKNSLALQYDALIIDAILSAAVFSMGDFKGIYQTIISGLPLYKIEVEESDGTEKKTD